jgi:hypothetical protein
MIVVSIIMFIAVDLQGIWTNATLTPLERGVVYDVTGKKVTLPPVPTLAITDRDAEDYQRRIRSALHFRNGDGSEADVSGEVNPAFLETARHLAQVGGVKRTSLIIDPADGKIPYRLSEEQRKAARSPEKFDSFVDRPTAERCLIGFESTGGPPMIPVDYNANYQIVQTPDYVMIMVEMIHDVRIVRMKGPHAPASIRKWLGDSIGRWEGDTLVVDTTNFTNKTSFKGSSEHLHVVERFRRVDRDTIIYRATIEDPSVFSAPWTVEYPFVAASDRIYEYACHEGNYSLTGILRGARKSEDGKRVEKVQ